MGYATVTTSTFSGKTLEKAPACWDLFPFGHKGIKEAHGLGVDWTRAVFMSKQDCVGGCFRAFKMF